MIAITNQFDLQSSLNNGTIDPILKDWLNGELVSLWEHLGRGECLAEFDLATHGLLWVATKTDNNLDWQYITQKMAVHEPEFVELHALANGQKALRIGFLADNDHMPLLYALTDCLHPEVAVWLQEYCIETDNQLDDFPDDETF